MLIGHSTPSLLSPRAETWEVNMNLRPAVSPFMAAVRQLSDLAAADRRNEGLAIF